MVIRGFENGAGADAFARAITLDPSQRAVIDLGDSATAAVIGAPGTGKTRVLIELIADRVENRQFSPNEILVVSPTRTSATHLRDRIARRLSIPTSGPLARTANSVAFQIVRDSDLSGEQEVPRLLTGGEQDQIISELIRGDLEDATGPLWPESLDSDVRDLRGFRTQLRDLMARCVEYGVSPQRLADLGRRTGRAEWIAAAEFIRAYDDVKLNYRARHFDSAELIQEAVAILEALPSSADAQVLALGSLAKLRLILLEDAQESTQATMSLVRAFHSRGAAVIAFGDPDISTGSFRGARPDVLGRLGQYLAPSPPRAMAFSDGEGRLSLDPGLARTQVAISTVFLTTDHRRRPGLVELHKAVAQHIGVSGVVGHRRIVESARRDDESAVAPAEPPALSCVHASSPAEEVAIIARRLRERHVFDGIPWERMAVIVRSGSLVPMLTKGLAALEVPTHSTSAGHALRDEFAVRAFVLALDVALGRKPVTATAATWLLTGPLGGLDAVSLRRLGAALRHEELIRQDSQDEPPSQQQPSEQQPSDNQLTGNTLSRETLRLPRIRRTDELLVEALQVPGALAMIDTAIARRATRLAVSLQAAKEEARSGASIEELLWGLWQRSRLADSWFAEAQGDGIVAEEANRNLDAVVALFSAAKRFVERMPDAPALNFLEQLDDTDVPEDTLAPRAIGESITVSTPTGTIGREFDVVVIARLQENVWPNLRVRGSLLGAEHLAAIASGDVAVDELGISETGTLSETAITDARKQVLHDELRMFAQSASRARKELFVTAIADEDSVPSPLFRLLPAPDAAVSGKHPLSLRGLVGRLRLDLTDRGDTAAAASLARLAKEGIAGAHPQQWYGFNPISTDAALNDFRDCEAPVRVSPSRMQAFETCPLHWLIGQLSGGPGSVAQGIGIMVHSALERATDFSAEALWESVDSQWGELSFEAGWESELNRNLAQDMTNRLASYLRDFESAGGKVIGTELGFALPIALASGTARLSGSIDRVEQFPDGTAVIVDLKTGKGDPTSDAAVADHPQLGAYQLAFADGALEGVAEELKSGGAKLVIVSGGTKGKNYYNPRQPAFSAEQLEKFRARVIESAEGMAGAVFVANIGAHCLDPWVFGSCRMHVVKAVSA